MLHGEQVPAPAGEYVPGGHIIGILLPAEAEHEYPAGHLLEPDPEPLVEVLPYASIEPAGHV